MVDFKLQDGDIGVLTLKAEMTIETAEELKAALLQAIEQCQQVRVAVDNVKEVDLSCIQLVCSAHRTAKAAGRSVALLGVSSVLEETIKDAGFNRHIGCGPGGGGQCLWNMETNNG